MTIFHQRTPFKPSEVALSTYLVLGIVEIMVRVSHVSVPSTELCSPVAEVFCTVKTMGGMFCVSVLPTEQQSPECLSVEDSAGGYLRTAGSSKLLCRAAQV